jgi:hypothetical protein
MTAQSLIYKSKTISVVFPEDTMKEKSSESDNTEPMYPGAGFLLVVVTGILFWGIVCAMVFK